MTAKLLMGLLDQVGAHKNGNIFQRPVKEVSTILTCVRTELMKQSDAEGYHDIVKQPMDLKTMRQRIRDGQIASVDDFERDMHLIFA